MNNARPLLWLFLIVNALALVSGFWENWHEGWEWNFQTVVRIINLLCTIVLGWIMIRRVPLDKE
ncbi:MAG: hypothetical protein L0220_07680 [Acidobacteria bacterium]|nr:hypothetical protein [Acidobacteriota bacterium]